MLLRRLVGLLSLLSSLLRLQVGVAVLPQVGGELADAWPMLHWHWLLLHGSLTVTVTELHASPSGIEHIVAVSTCHAIGIADKGVIAAGIESIGVWIESHLVKYALLQLVLSIYDPN